MGVGSALLVVVIIGLIGAGVADTIISSRPIEEPEQAPQDKVDESLQKSVQEEVEQEMNNTNQILQEKGGELGSVNKPEGLVEDKEVLPT